MTDVKAVTLAAERLQYGLDFPEDGPLVANFALSRLTVADDEIVAEMRRMLGALRLELPAEITADVERRVLAILNRLTAAEAENARLRERVAELEKPVPSGVVPGSRVCGACLATHKAECRNPDLCRHFA